MTEKSLIISPDFEPYNLAVAEFIERTRTRIELLQAISPELNVSQRSLFDRAADELKAVFTGQVQYPPTAAIGMNHRLGNPLRCEVYFEPCGGHKPLAGHDPLIHAVTIELSPVQDIVTMTFDSYVEGNHDNPQRAVTQVMSPGGLGKVLDSWFQSVGGTYRYVVPTAQQAQKFKIWQYDAA